METIAAHKLQNICLVTTLPFSIIDYGISCVTGSYKNLISELLISYFGQL